MNRLTAYSVIALAYLFGGVALLMFGWCVVAGPFPLVRFSMSYAQIVLWNGLLSLMFFVQHSGMVRRSFRGWLARRVPEAFHAASYALASGIVLAAVPLLWQPSQTVIAEASGALRWLLRGIALFGVAGVVWGAMAFRDFDPFGRRPIRSRLAGRQCPPPSFVVCGPYRWVRHPFYFFTLVLLWAMPDLSLDRLFFNVLWSAWVVVGAYLEERDLVEDFGEDYRHYQKTVPMLMPWKRHL